MIMQMTVMHRKHIFFKSRMKNWVMAILMKKKSFFFLIFIPSPLQEIIPYYLTFVQILWLIYVHKRKISPPHKIIMVAAKLTNSYTTLVIINRGPIMKGCNEERVLKKSFSSSFFLLACLVQDLYFLPLFLSQTPQTNLEASKLTHKSQV